MCVWPNRLPLLCAAPPLGLSEKSVEKIVAKQAALGWSAALCPITHCFGPELEMALNTEQEEKRLLKEQIQHLEVCARTHALYTKLHVHKMKPLEPVFVRLARSLLLCADVQAGRSEQAAGGDRKGKTRGVGCRRGGVHLLL